MTIVTLGLDLGKELGPTGGFDGAGLIELDPPGRIRRHRRSF